MNRNSFYRFWILVLFSVIGTKGFAQADTNSVKPFIRICADSMVNGFSTGDYETMERFTNAKLVEFMGGKKKYIAFMKKAMTEGDMAEAKFEEAIIGSLLQVVKTEKGFQCLVEQKLTIIFEGYRIKATSTLHGYTNKEGKIWKFGDVGDKKPELLQKIIPDLDKRLIIPKKVTSTEKI